MKLLPSLDYTQVRPEQPEGFYERIFQMLNKAWGRLAYLINGHISFGDGTNSDNIDGVWASVTTPGVANTDFTVTHNLGRIPAGYQLMSSDVATTIYTGSVAPTTTQITLRSTAATAHIKLFIFLLLLSFARMCAAQTTVNISVTDTPDGQTWNNGKWNVTLRQQPGTSGGPPFNIITGGGSTADQSGLLSGTGTASILLPANSNIAPALSWWYFTLCPNTSSAQCYSQGVIIGTTSPQTVAFTPPSIRINILATPPPITAYADQEIVGAIQGSIYYNVTGLTYKQCDAAASGNCTLWSAAGVRSGPVNPATCTPGQLFSNTSTNPPLLYVCGTGNVWTVTGGATPAPPQGQVQVYNVGALGPGCINTPPTGPTQLNCDTHFKGVNPYIDVTTYGVRAINPSAIPGATGITANITATQFTAAVSTSTCASQAGSVCFVNGDGVVIYGAGTASGLATPGPPTVTPSLALMGTRTGIVTNGPVGATTYNYQIIAETKNGGYTPASTVGSTATGAAALGRQSSNANCSRANDVVTCTTSSAHGFLVGCTIVNCGEVYTDSMSDFSFNGWWQVATAVDSTHFTFTSAIDTRQGGSAGPTTGGIAYWWNCNHLTWTAVTGAWKYYIYGRTGGSLTLVGVSMPQGASITDTTFDDFGSPMMDLQFYPPFIPTSPPVSGAANHLVTTIASGAGTTTLTLAAAATTTVIGATIRLDNTPNILTAANAAASSAGLFQGGDQGGTIYFPPGGAAVAFPTASFLDLTTLPSVVAIAQSGMIWASETWQIPAGQSWHGNAPFPQKGVQPQFAFTGQPQFIVNGALPGIYATNIGGVYFTGFNLSTGFSVGNGAVVMFGEGQFQYTFDNMFFGSSTNSGDYMGIDLYLRGVPLTQSAAFGAYNKVMFTGGPTTIPNGTTHTPLWFCNDCGTTKMTDMFINHRGLNYRADPSGGANLDIDFVYQQGNLQPAITTCCTAVINVGAMTLDSVPNPFIAGYMVNNNGPSYYSFTKQISDPGNLGPGSVASIGGLRIPTSGVAQRINLAGLTNAQTEPNRDNCAFIGGFSWDNAFYPTYNGTISTSSSLFSCYASIAVGPNNSVMVPNLQPPAPTCSVSAGGAVPVGTYYYRFTPIWQNNSEGVSSFTSTSCSTTPGNQTVTISWTLVPGNAKGYDIYSSANGGASFISLSCSQPAVGGTVTSFVFAGTPCGVGGSSLPSGGPTMLMPGTQGLATPSILMGNAGLTSTITSAPTANRIVNLADNAGIIHISGAQETAFDNANRADGAIGANWTNVNNSLNIASNQFKGNVAADNIAFWSGYPLSAVVGQSQFSEATQTVLSARNGPGVYLGNSGGSGGYLCTENPTTLAIYDVFNGAANANRSSTAVTGVSGDVLRAEVIPGASSNVINCTLTQSTGITIVSWTDSSKLTTSGSPGLDIFSGAARFDNWSGGTFHPLAQLDQEQDWTQPQHLTASLTVGNTVPITGTLPLGVVYASGGVNIAGGTSTVLSTYNTPSATGNANLTATSMIILTSAEHTYTFQWTISLVTPGTSCTGNTTVELDAIYTDPNGAGAQTQNLGVVTIASSGNGTAGMVATGVDNIRAKTGTAVQYQTSNFTAGTGCSPAPTYKVYPVLSQVN